MIHFWDIVYVDLVGIVFEDLFLYLDVGASEKRLDKGKSVKFEQFYERCADLFDCLSSFRVLFSKLRAVEDFVEDY